MMQFRPLPGAALLFDIDGTLVDTDALHLEAFNVTFAPLGHQFDRDRFVAELQGLSLTEIMERFLPGEPATRQRAVLEEKEALFRTYAARGLEPLPGLMDLLAAADACGLPTIAVTNAPRPNAELMLGSLGIRDRFRGVVLGDELERGKPDPMPYLEGLRLLGATPELSVAFEDSRAGVRSAVGAGIATVGLRTTLSDADLRGAGATLTIADYRDPAVLDFIGRRVAGRSAP